MADDVSETAKMVSSMKEGLERITKIKQLLTLDPLCDDSGSCSYGGVRFTQPQENEEKIVSMITKYAKSNISDLQSDANSIREELQQFKDTIKQKESLEHEASDLKTKSKRSKLTMSKKACNAGAARRSRCTGISQTRARLTKIRDISDAR